MKDVIAAAKELSRELNELVMAKTGDKPVCPDCGALMFKAGKRRTTRTGPKRQNYECPKCRRRTLNPKF